MLAPKLQSNRVGNAPHVSFLRCAAGAAVFSKPETACPAPKMFDHPDPGLANHYKTRLSATNVLHMQENQCLLHAPHQDFRLNHRSMF